MFDDGLYPDIFFWRLVMLLMLYIWCFLICFVRFFVDCIVECAGMLRDWSMQTGKWAVVLEGLDSSSDPVCLGKRNFWKELESKLLKQYVERTYTKVTLTNSVDGKTQDLHTTFAWQKSQETCIQRWQANLHAKDTAADYNIISNLRFDEHHWAHPKQRPAAQGKIIVVDPLIGCRCSTRKRDFKGVEMPLKYLWEVKWYKNFNHQKQVWPSKSCSKARAQRSSAQTAHGTCLASQGKKTRLGWQCCIDVLGFCSLERGTFHTFLNRCW